MNRSAIEDLITYANAAAGILEHVAATSMPGASSVLKSLQLAIDEAKVSVPWRCSLCGQMIESDDKWVEPEQDPYCYRCA